jgi:hypothetical protein
MGLTCNFRTGHGLADRTAYWEDAKEVLKPATEVSAT